MRGLLLLATVLIFATSVAKAQSGSDTSVALQLAELKQKLQLRDALQREIAELQKSTGEVEHFLVSVKLVALDYSGALQTSPEFAELRTAIKEAQGGMEESGSLLPVDAPRSLISMFGKTPQPTGVRIIAQPTLAVSSDAPASSFAGGEVFVRNRQSGTATMQAVRFGSEVNVDVQSIGSGRAVVGLELCQSEVDSNLSIRLNGEEFPGRIMCEFKDRLELWFGQPLMLTGCAVERGYSSGKSRRSSSDQGTTEYVVIISVEKSEQLAPAHRLGPPSKLPSLNPSGTLDR